MISETNTDYLPQLSVNKDLIEKIIQTNQNTQGNMKDKTIKDIIQLIIERISSALNSKDSQVLGNLFVETSNFFQETLSVNDWPSIDKKQLDKLNTYTDCYYTLIKNRYLLKKKNNFDGVRDIFEYSGKFLDLIALDKLMELYMSENLIYKFFLDYFAIYQKLISLSDLSKLSEVKEDFWEMPMALQEVLFFDNSIVNKPDDISNITLISLYSCMFKAKVYEEISEKKELSLNYDFNSKISVVSSYFNYLKKNAPYLYLEMVIIQAVTDFFSANNFQKIIKELASVWEFILSYSKMNKKSYDYLIVKQHQETIKGLILAACLAEYKSLSSKIFEKLLLNLGLEPRDFAFSSNFSILNDLKGKLNFLKDIHPKLEEMVIDRAIELSEARRQSYSLEALEKDNEFLNKLF